jgi:hypothetical protein
MRLIFACFLSFFTASISFAGNVNSLSYSGTNVTTGAYVTYVASTSITASHIMICDTSGVLVKMAVGAAASEVDYFAVPISGCALFPFNPPLPAGSRLSLKAISATASSGFNSSSLLQ